MSQPQAFLSYTRIDDEFFGGSITALRAALELGVRVVTGNRTFQIFQDVDGIELGQQWNKRLGQALFDARFLIPIITPLFFTSDACRDELQKFMAHEKAVGRDDLILPIYFVTTPRLEKPDLRIADTLAVEIHSRQRRDWRPQADLPISDPAVRRELRILSEQIASALDRTSNENTSLLSSAQSSTREIQFQKNSNLVSKATLIDVNPITPKTLLWVDDNPDNNIHERAAMKKYNISFVLSKTTTDALHVLSKQKFDAIISDMSRPPQFQAGFALLEAARSRGYQMPYFIYAGSISSKHLAETLRRGAQGTTNDPADLIKMVIGALWAELH